MFKINNSYLIYSM